MFVHYIYDSVVLKKLCVRVDTEHLHAGNVCIRRPSSLTLAPEYYYFLYEYLNILNVIPGQLKKKKTLLTDNDHKHRSDEQPADFVELVNVVGPRFRRRAGPVRYGPSEAIYARRSRQLGVVFVLVCNERIPAKGQVRLFSVQHHGYVVEHVGAIVPAVHFVDVAALG